MECVRLSSMGNHLGMGNGGTSDLGATRFKHLSSPDSMFIHLPRHKKGGIADMHLLRREKHWYQKKWAVFLTILSGVFLTVLFSFPIWGQVVITTQKLTVTGGTPPPPSAPFPPVTITTDKLTVSGGVPPPPKPPFPGVTITTSKLTVSGRTTY